jgi:hypothetical protein
VATQQHERLSARTGPSNGEIERIYREWDRALAANDATALLEMYAPDAILESPLIPHLMHKDAGICRGRGEIKALFDILATRKPDVRQFFRTGYFTNGETVMWEYPRATPQGEQMDFVEVMEVKDGLIQAHRVYWGWYGVGVLNRNAYHR